MVFIWRAFKFLALVLIVAVFFLPALPALSVDDDYEFERMNVYTRWPIMAFYTLALLFWLVGQGISALYESVK